MKVINYGQKYEIYPDDLKTYDELPAGTYKVGFHPMEGFWLDKAPDFELKEEKIYGNHLEKIDKVLSSYQQMNRSLGVILSGEKGMGKSLFVQLLSVEANKQSIPVIIVNKPYKGVADFIDKIDQEVLVIFDEFEKVFSERGDGNQETQNDLLSLFDGMSQRKRIYAITVNKLHLLSEFITSRPGRFHYHIRFDYPTPDEIEEYMKDKLEPALHNQVKHVIAFSRRVKLNYDSLRAIVFELSMGHSFAEAIGDLNILNIDQQRYDIRVYFSDGKIVTLRNENIDLFSENISVGGHTMEHSYFNISFNGNALYIQGEDMVVKGESIELDLHDPEEHEEKLSVSHISIHRKEEKGVNYKLTV